MKEPDAAAGYARVSAKKQAVEGDSLETQGPRIQRYIEAQGWTVWPERVFEEPFTGTTDKRPVYGEIIQLIKKHPGRVKHLVVCSIDRFSREGSRRYQEMKEELSSLGVELHDIGGVIQPKVNSLAHLGVSYPWSERSPSAISEVVLAEVGSQEVSTILTRLIGAEIGLVRAGYHVGPADDGYVAKRIYVDGKKRYAQFPDPERAHFFRTMFSMRADGTFSDKEIVDHVNGFGFRTKSHNRWDKSKTKIVGRYPGKPLIVKRLQEIILRPAYCGIIVEKWTQDAPVRARGGEPLVSIDTFNRANRGKRFIDVRDDGNVRMLYDQQAIRVVAKRHRFNLRWPYKSIAMCPHCRQPLWASASRGRSGKHFAAYHCNRGHQRYAVRQSELDAAFSAFLAKLRFVDEFWDDFDISVRAEYRELESAKERFEAQSKATEAQLEERKSDLAEAFALATSDSMRASLERKVQAIDDDIAAMHDVHRNLDVSESELDRFLGYVRRVLEHPAEILSFITNIREQLALYRLFFEEFPTLDEIVSGTAKLTATFGVFQGYGCPESRMVDSRGLNWNTLHQEIDRWKESYWAIDAIFERMKLATVLPENSSSEDDVGSSRAHS